MQLQLCAKNVYFVFLCNLENGLYPVWFICKSLMIKDAKMESNSSQSHLVDEFEMHEQEVDRGLRTSQENTPKDVTRQSNHGSSIENGNGENHNSDRLSDPCKTKSERTVPDDQYWVKVRRLATLIPSTLDHVSDILVLQQLLKYNLTTFFWIGLIIDLMPGPIAVYQFALLGYGWKSLLLIFHPINAYLHTGLLITNSKYSGEFSCKVVDYSHDVQGLLESPLQAIYTLSLMALSYLPTPLEKAQEGEWTIKNAFGQEISVSFWPALSVALSFVSIIVNSARAINLFDREQSPSLKQTLSWLLFLSSSIIFRLEVWVLLCTFMAEYVLIVMAIVFSTNFAILLKMQKMSKVDPFLASLYSLAFPITYLKSILPSNALPTEKRRFKMAYKLMTICGSLVLLLSLYSVTYLVQHHQLKQSQFSKIRRDHFIPAVICTSIICVISIISTYILSSSELQKFLPHKHLLSNVSSKLIKLFSIILRLFLIIAVFVVFGLQFASHRDEKAVSFQVKDVCGHQVDLEFEGYIRGGSLEKTHKKFIQHCKDYKGDSNPLGCFGKFKVIDDLSPASPIIGYSQMDPLLLIKTTEFQNSKNLNFTRINDSDTQLSNTQILLDDVKTYCGKETRVVCYFTY